MTLPTVSTIDVAEAVPYAFPSHGARLGLKYSPPPTGCAHVPCRVIAFPFGSLSPPTFPLRSTTTGTLEPLPGRHIRPLPSTLYMIPGTSPAVEFAIDPPRECVAPLSSVATNRVRYSGPPPPVFDAVVILSSFQYRPPGLIAT